MGNWSEGYVTSVQYEAGFFRELVPSFLSFVALTRSLDAPGGDDRAFRYLELGCGRGISANVIAAANPHVELTAIDFDPGHIARARSIARKAALSNVTFVESSFENAANEALGTFDIIALHGVLSWVSPANRAAIVRICERSLNAGGLLYASYNVHPGWNKMQPVRELFRQIAGLRPNDPPGTQIQECFRLAKELQQLGVQHFDHETMELLQEFEKDSTSYLFHELMNCHWEIMTLPQVLSEFEAAKVSYVSTVALKDALDDINLTVEQRKLLEGYPDREFAQTLRDFMTHTRFLICSQGAESASGAPPHFKSVGCKRASPWLRRS
jgi:SAM-dependent methyltransferase